MHLADLHADTPSRMFKKHLPFDSTALHVALPYLTNLDSYTQFFAFFCDKKRSDQQVFCDFFSMHRQFISELDAKKALLPPHCRFYFTVEDGRLLCGDEERLLLLHECGVRIFTPLWQGSTHLGGAFDTKEALTPFGRRALQTACDLNIIPDVSHASREAVEDILTIASARHSPCLATHSNAYDVCAHPRNLHKRHVEAIRDSGGLIGISLAPQHLSLEGRADIDDVLRHIDYYLSEGCRHTLALGCDFDGIDTTPRGLENIARLTALKEAMAAHGIDEDVIEDIFYGNIHRFIEKHVEEPAFST